MISTDCLKVYPDLASAEEENNRSKQCCFESCEDKEEDEEGVLLLTVHPVFQTEILVIPFQ